MDLGPIGIWSAALRYGDRAEAGAAAHELEQLGFGALWVPGGAGGDIFDGAAALLDATTTIPVATGILNLWMHTAAETAGGHARLTRAHPDRFLLGIGVSHAPLVDAQEAGRYRAPLAAVRQYLDDLDAAVPPVPVRERALAALGPRMLELARDRSLGAHPYLVTPEHTHQARAVLGDGPLLAPEQAVVLDTDPSAARAVARAHLAIYLGLPNYVNNFLRLGFDERDVQDGGSDRLVDGLVAWGDEAAIARRVADHHAAGADHVCVQLLSTDLRALDRPGWRTLAAALVP
jgi:probable F420-dependent oxidoreductase